MLKVLIDSTISNNIESLSYFEFRKVKDTLIVRNTVANSMKLFTPKMFEKEAKKRWAIMFESLSS